MKRMVAISLMLWVTMSYAVERDLESGIPHNGNSPPHQPLLDYQVYRQQNDMRNYTPANVLHYQMPQEQIVYLPQQNRYLMLNADRRYTKKSIAMVSAVFFCMAVLKIYIGYDTHN